MESKTSLLTKEHFGPGSINALAEVINDIDPKKIFLVTGNKSYSLSGAQSAIDQLLHDRSITRYYGFSQNPKLKEAEAGVEMFLSGDYDVIVAIGGGSVMDMAKLINVFANHEVAPKDLVLKKATIDKPLTKLIAIPTTSGTGSEVTHFAVVYMDGIKYSIAHERLLPNVAIVDPELTYNLSPAVTKASALDALCQAIESYWNVFATEDSKKIALESIEIILPNIPKLSQSPIAKEVRIDMANGALLAGKAINITKTTAPHAFSYYLTSKFGMPHGEAVALFMTLFLDYNKSAIDDELSKVLARHFGSNVSTGFSQMLQQLGVEHNIQQFILENDVDVDEMISSVNLERLKNNPVPVVQDEIKRILK